MTDLFLSAVFREIRLPAAVFIPGIPVKEETAKQVLRRLMLLSRIRRGAVSRLKTIIRNMAASPISSTWGSVPSRNVLWTHTAIGITRKPTRTGNGEPLIIREEMPTAKKMKMLQGIRMKVTPTVVITPLPALNLRNGDQLWPMTVTIPITTSWLISIPNQRARRTIPIPLTASKTPTAIPAFLETVLNTLLAPVLPYCRISIPRAHRFTR